VFFINNINRKKKKKPTSWSIFFGDGERAYRKNMETPTGDGRVRAGLGLAPPHDRVVTPGVARAEHPAVTIYN
jgi:hypothetical protein